MAKIQLLSCFIWHVVNPIDLCLKTHCSLTENGKGGCLRLVVVFTLSSSPNVETENQAKRLQPNVNSPPFCYMSQIAETGPIVKMSCQPLIFILDNPERRAQSAKYQKCPLKVVSDILGRNLNDHIHLIFPHDPLAAHPMNRGSKKNVSL